MSRMDSFPSRHPLAQQALDELKTQRAWEAADAGRMGGGGGGSGAVDYSDLECASDRELILRRLDEEAARQAYANETR